MSSKLKLTLLSQDVKPKINQEAYDLYLQGRYFLSKRGTGLTKALELFKQAADMDSSFAQAYSGMASCYAFLYNYNLIPSLEGINESKKWARKAIALDSNSAEAYGALAMLAFFTENNWEFADQMYKKSLSINPNDVLVLANYAGYFFYFEDNSIESEKRFRAGIKLDPLFFVSHIGLANALAKQGKNELAETSFKKSIDLNVNSTNPFTSYSQFLLTINNSTEAILLLEDNMRLTGRSQMMLASLCEAYAEAGRKDDVKRIYNELHTMSRTSYVAPIILGMAAVAAGKLDEGFEYYDRAFAQKNPGFYMWSNPTYNKLKFKTAFVKDSRFKKLIDRLAFP